MKNKTALVTGICGQDGPYLARHLLDKGYKVYGMYRRSSSENFWRLHYCNVYKDINLICGDITDMSSVIESINISQPNEIYNLAAQSFVGASFNQPISTTMSDAIGPLNFLEAIRQLKKDIKFYQASTSELYGTVKTNMQNEETPFRPNSPYAIAKLYGYHMVRSYREGYNMFACNGILFNHEGPTRGIEFVTRKITDAVAQIKLGVSNELKLGNLDAKRDWGYALDYVKGMHMMMQHETPDDYVIATGETHSVREFCDEAFKYVGLNYEDFVKVDERYKRPNDVHLLCGDATKAYDELNWIPETKFKDLVKIMVDADLDRWERNISSNRLASDPPINTDYTALIKTKNTSYKMENR